MGPQQKSDRPVSELEAAVREMAEMVWSRPHHPPVMFLGTSFGMVMLSASGMCVVDPDNWSARDLTPEEHRFFLKEYPHLGEPS